MFPITVDPTYASLAAIKPNLDTFVQSGLGSGQASATELKMGNNGAGNVARMYLMFPMASLKGLQVKSATLGMYETHAWSCNPRSWEVWDTGGVTASTVWTSQPGWYQRWASSTATKGYSSSCAEGWVTQNVTSLAAAWAGNGNDYNTMGVRATDEGDAYAWKKFASAETATAPYLSVTYNRKPNAAAMAGMPFPAVTYKAPSWSSSLVYTSDLTPEFQMVATDPDGNNVNLKVEIHASSSAGYNQAPLTSCQVGAASGQAAKCSVGALADNSVFYARVAVQDDQGLWNGAWSPWATFRTAAVTPAVPVVSCPAPYATSGAWTDAAPAGPVTCTITAAGTGTSSPAYIHYRLDGGAEQRVAITPSSDPNAAKTTVTVPASTGGHSVEAWTASITGKTSAHKTHSLGWGNASLTAPVAPSAGVQVAATTTGAIRIAANGPPKGAASSVTGKVQWRVSGYGTSETGKWNDATGVSAVSLTGTGSATTAVTYAASWDAMTADVDKAQTPEVGLNDRTPVLLDVQVCFTYSTGTQCTWSASPVTISRVPHAFGGGFPTSSAGPGQVALFTGEFNQSVTDVSVPGYTGDLSLSRSHATYANSTTASVTPAAGVFGPGWTAGLDGSDAGLAGMTPIDSTHVDGSMVFQDGDGTSLVYRPIDGLRRTTAAMTTKAWVAADEDTRLEGTTLAWNETSKAFTLTEDDGTTTTFTATTAPATGAAGVFAPTSVTEPGSGTTTYTRSAAGLVTRILAPVPAGMTAADCPDNGSVAGLKPGCRALRVVYGVNGAPAGQVGSVSMEISTPDALTVKACDGTTSTAAAGSMASVPVACYTYDASKRLTKVTDPRSGLGTSYGYGSQNEITSVTPAGQAPFQLAYSTEDARLKLASVSRPNPSGGGATALTRVRYGIQGAAGMPDMSSDRTRRWGQASAPTYAAAVFGPDYTGDITNPGQDGWTYADLSYTDAQGYTTNTASYGAGAWLATYTRYNEQGNVVLALDADAVARALTATEGVTFADGQVYDASALGTVTAYNPDTTATTTPPVGVPAKAPAGSFVTDVWGPQRTATLRDGTWQIVRPHTKTLYDQGAPNNGVNPKTSTGYGLATTVTVTASDTGMASEVETTSRTFTGYEPKTPGDDATSGWTLGAATSSTADMNLDGSPGAGDITTRTFHNEQGRTVETRQPSEADTGGGAGTTLTSYYTVAAQTGADAACGSKPAWAGLVCATRKAAQPAGQTLPDERTTRYTYQLAPAETVETSGAVTRTTTTTHLLDGRTDTTSTSVAGLSSSVARPGVKTVYDPATGAVTGTIELDANGAATGPSQTTVLDSWGRQASNTNQLGDQTTTTYDTAGRVATVTDGKGVTSYGYDGTDLAGKTERRGLTTRVVISRSAGKGDVTFAGAYDTDAKMYRQSLPGGLTQDVTFDEAGEPVGMSYSGQVTPYTTSTDADGNPVYTPGAPTTGVWMAWTQANDPTGRVVRDWTGQGAAFDGKAGTTTTPTEVTKPGDAIGYDRAYWYDNAGRLDTVRDRTATTTGTTVTPTSDASPAVPCTVRWYGYEGTTGRNGNRTGHTSQTHTDGSCTSTPTSNTASWYEYDTADRATNSAGYTGTYTYDPLGRQTTVPASDAPDPGKGDLTLAYYDTDLPQRVKQGSTDTTFTLDVAGRRLTGRTTSTDPALGSSTVVRHYTDGTDNPAWIATTPDGGTPAITRYAESLAGDLGAQLDQDGSMQISLATLHGDVATTITIGADQPSTTAATSINGWSDYTEYGAPRDPTTTRAIAGPAGYGWLGAKQRSTTPATAGLTLMGDRYYNPTRGLFTSLDPEPGGNPTAYTYPLDPINGYDLDGRWGINWGNAWNSVKSGARSALSWAGNHKMEIATTALMFVPGVSVAAWGYRAYRVYAAVRTAQTVVAAGRAATVVNRARIARASLYATRSKSTSRLVNSTFHRGSFSGKHGAYRSFAYHYAKHGRNHGGPSGYAKAAHALRRGSNGKHRGSPGGIRIDNRWKSFW
ncbi:DNRLRE domain-containing protein [Arsenicicoccus cauae]|uniref:DNRLRE domain-containing protein n=1 Tax=Arsenicicoccus cauae TaxID=2663847 RepID=UPI0018A77F3C|nr:DNRLRE domain-containing protein [Arsenicicoccus cauae]